ncbi:MAG: DUF2721 domain-containing protein [Bacteroidetes bacterium]|nr:DUF2721 domain-containing protein [Bacteroidota bacterium]
MDLMLSETLSVTQAIQLILAPAVMINACGLLLLGISNKFSSVLNRIRLLTGEKRSLLNRASDSGLLPLESQRIESIKRQLNGLLERALLLRDAILCYFVSVGIFIVTSILIGFDFFFQIPWLRYFIIGIFLVGMIVVFGGVVFGVKDTSKGFSIVKFEVDVDK